MSNKRKVGISVLTWMLVMTGLHLWLNFNWTAVLNDRLPEDKRRLNVAYIPVT